MSGRIAREGYPKTERSKRVTLLLDTYINTSTEGVTRVSDQLYVKAMMMAANIKAVNCSIIPSFSDMPICRVLAVFVNVFEAWPLGRVSRVDTGSENSAYDID